MDCFTLTTYFFSIFSVENSYIFQKQRVYNLDVPLYACISDVAIRKSINSLTLLHYEI